VEQCSELVEYVQIEDGHLDKANRNGISPKNKGFSQINGMQLVIVSEPMQNNNIRTDLPTYFILVLENTINS